MKTKKKRLKMTLLMGLLLLATNVLSVDPNFHIYLCFGQSNMEGQGAIEAQDKTVDSRFKVLQSLSCSDGRVAGNWYPAIPPLCQCVTGLSPADYFGRTMVANLPDSITVGVINVAVGGCDIRLFDKDLWQDYDSTYNEEWYLSKVRMYDWNPRKHLMDLARLAQKDGVIKGILLHQGEANTGNSQWPQYVKKVYNDMLNELSLNADSVPLLSGEVVYTGVYSAMNSIIRTLPSVIPTAHVISAEGLSGDWAHFYSEGYRILGMRYAAKMLPLIGVGKKIVEPEKYYFEPECSLLGTNWNLITDKMASNNTFVTIKAGLNNTTEVSNDSANIIYIDFNTKSDTTFHVYARVYCTTLKSDSYWFKVDNGSFEYVNGLPKGLWTWTKIKSYDLKAGKHTLSIANGEEGAKLDKICISNFDILPTNMGDNAVKICNPVVYTIPGKIEAESYSYQSGVTTTATGDVDGDKDVTSIDTNDYLEYIFDVPTDTIYKATFRYASNISSGVFAVLMNEKSVGSISFPSSGSLQTYMSATKDLSLQAGRHTLKLLATSGGIKLNWMMFEKVDATGVENVLENGLHIYPNPTNGVVNIKSDAFQFSKVEVLDFTGKRVYVRKFNSTNQVSLNLPLQTGIYFLKLTQGIYSVEVINGQTSTLKQTIMIK